MAGREGGVLEVDLPNAKVIWRLRWDELKLCDDWDAMYEQTTVYGLGCDLLFRPKIAISSDRACLKFKLHLAGEFEVHAVINGEEFTLTQDKKKVCPNRVPEGKDVEIVIHFVRLAPNSLTDASALPELLLKSHLQKTKALRAAEGEAKRLDGELQKAKAEAKGLGAELAQQKGCQQESEAKANRLAAEVDRCHALINAGSHQAAERECRLTGSVVKIQAKWRQVLTRRRFLRERDERAWRRKQAKCQAETPYDAILAFDSLAKFLEERKIEFLQKAESQFEVAKESANRYRIIAVVGLFDKGKTWLLNKLFGVNLPAGKLCTTRGLSFLWIKERRMLLLDSAGVQSTVSYRKQAVDAIHDAMTTESLVFKMISRISHQMIFVVNDLTWFEQKYLAMLHQNYVQCKKNKELIVVHNLRTTSDVAEATLLFKGQVMQCYDGEPSPGLNFTAYHGEGVPPVHHIGLCYEFSKAGDEFNAKNREHLLQSLEIGNRLGTTMALTDILQSELSDLLPKYVNIETTAPEACLTSPGQAISVSFESAASPSAESNGYCSSGNFSMHLSPEQARVTTKTRGIISPLGEIIAHNVSFDPVANVFDKELENGNGMRRFVRIECPGVDEDDIDFSDDVPNGVKVVINKKPPIEEHAVHEVEPIRQTHGVWMQEFSFDQSEGCFKPCEDETTLENGVLTIVLKKTAPRKWRVGKAGARQSNVSEQGQAPSPTASVCTSTSWAAVSEAISTMPARAAGVAGA